MPPYRTRPTGRRSGENTTRNDILTSARKAFAEHGFDGVSLRQIAADAKVDTALIHHYFESKDGLFRSAIEDVFGRKDLTVTPHGSPQQIAYELVEKYISFWEDQETQEALCAVLRSAMANEHARQLFVNFMNKEIYDTLASSIPKSDARVRIGFIGSQMLGAAMIRYVFSLEPLSLVSKDFLVATLAHTVEGYLTRDLETLPVVEIGRVAI